MTFKVCNHGSKYPYLLHKIDFVDSQFGTTVYDFPLNIFLTVPDMIAGDPKF